MKKFIFFITLVNFISNPLLAINEEYSCDQHVILYVGHNYYQSNRCPQTNGEMEQLTQQLRQLKAICKESDRRKIRLDDILHQQCKNKNGKLCSLLPALSYPKTKKTLFNSEFLQFLLSKMEPKISAKDIDDIYRLNYFRQELDLPPIKKDKYLAPNRVLCQTATSALKVMKFKDIILANFDFLRREDQLNEGLKKCADTFLYLRNSLQEMERNDCLQTTSGP